MLTQPLLIVHIEDNDSHAQLVSDVATQATMPCRVIRFVDAESGLDYLQGDLQSFHRDQHPYPNLILLELDLPGMSGLTFLRHVRAHERTKGIPIVVLTKSANEHEITAAYRYGANSYVVKPADRDDFLIKLTELSMYWHMTSEIPHPAQSAVVV
ncbi:MAG: response regulator [candidate division Zixibacteria bacterium]|nr:response regulator [candidate division Zixibacteria bacterium]